MHGIAIVGAGKMGRAHAAAWSRLGLGERIRYICTRSPGTAPPLAPSARVVTEFDDVLADPEVNLVSICTPTPSHAELAVRALRAGRHVLLEKPVALDLRGAAAIMAADAASDAVLMVAHVVRFFAGYQRLRHEVESGRIGRARAAWASRSSAAPTWAAWLADEARSGGMLVDFAIHDFDQLNLHLGRPVAVTTVETGPTGRFESRIEYAEGGVGHVVTNPQLPAGSPFESSLEVRGTAGTVSFRYPDAAPDEPFVRQAAYFLDCVETRRPPEACPPESAVLALRLALAARESLRSGRTIEIPESPAPVDLDA